MRWMRILRVCIVTVSAAVTIAGLGPARADAAGLAHYLDVPLTNRHAAAGPGGVDPRLPYDRAELRSLLNRARAEHIPPKRYAALLFQYWLVDTTDKAGIDLRGWNPRTGVAANRSNLVKSYTYYEALQLGHRELQWAGMGGQVGADFGGGLIDFELMTGLYSVPGVADAARAIVDAAVRAVGPQVLGSLPRGLVALADAGGRITPDDLRYIIGMILVMQKNIFSDLMPMHDAYLAGGIAALTEFRDAGLFGNDILNAWKDIASHRADRVARGNATLLRREQYTIVGPQWNAVRAYKGAVGEAVCYLSTVGGNPSVAGVVPPRAYHPVEYTFLDAAGRKQTLTLPLPNWNWSVFPARWDYITHELLPKYAYQVNNDWPALSAELHKPYELQLESHRPLANIPGLMQSALQTMKVTPAQPDTPLGAH
ncbi:MAG: hypothetical protein HOQ24_03140 [Mycobacteriaceae bacterium]|nr:hypothetical protein [Mycobacteriaceae bacterium]